jgi:hypothetical protein
MDEKKCFEFSGRIDNISEAQKEYYERVITRLISYENLEFTITFKEVKDETQED